MDDEAHIRLVYPHAEGDGGHNHVHLFHQEPVLVLGPGLRIQSGMIRKGLYTVDIEELGKFLDLFAAQAVDYAGLPGILLYELDYLAFGIGLVPDFVIQVRPVERGLEHLGVEKAEILLDVALDLRGGSCRQSYDGSRAYFLYNGFDASVLRPEVMPPLRDAVRLVNGIERYVYLFEQGYILRLRKGFGSHIQQPGRA